MDQGMQLGSVCEQRGKNQAARGQSVRCHL